MKPSAPGRRGSAQVKQHTFDKLVDGVARVRISQGGTIPDDIIDQEEAQAKAEAEVEALAQAQAQAEAEAQAAAEAARAAAEAQAQAQAEAEARVKAQAAAAEAQAQAAAAVAAAEKERVRAAEQAAAEAAAAAAAAAEQEKEKERVLAAAAAAAAEQEKEKQRVLAAEKAAAEAAAAAEKEQAARAAEAARLEAEKREKEMAAEREMAAAVESQRRLLEQQREAEAAAAAAEAAREAEAERLASIQRANEAVLAAAAITAKESAELEAARKKAEEVRRKREMFLSDVSDFSTTFEAQSAEADEAKRRLAETEAETLQQGMRGLSGAYVAPEARVAEVAAPSSSSLSSSSSSSSAEPVGPAFVVTSTSAAAEAPAPQDDGKNKQALASLSSSLFATSGVVASAGQAGAAPVAETETFRMPTRIGLRGPAITPSQIPAPNSAADDDDDEEEGAGGDESISNVLTRDERRNLTATERAYWRALQADLTTRRREFHGAVTYAFDGIFSWQMYGSAEAVDETGSAYTEYLMRCQWGTTWDNMQPWISARRYREFDSLDHDLKRAFPAMEHSMPRLPAKDFFRFLEQDVIEKRRSALENYMTRVVAHLPTILRSDQVSDFLGIKERIATIRPLLARIESGGSSSGGGGGGGSAATVRRDSELLRDRGSSASSSSPSSSPRPPLPPAEGRVDLDRSGLVLSVDAAEAAKVAANARFFIDSELSQLEEQVRDLTLLLRSATPQELLFKNQRAYYLLSAITTDWPRLRATTDMASQHADMDFTLIPRAMQIEEDLVRSIGDFRSLLAAHSLGTD